ncbi:hypothetical protein [Enemella sp. A6]|uniref:hypothetical protein n=1 Tax=Enemella sp. A6 TaxID=3440152 RepID=UPI003EBA415F
MPIKRYTVHDLPERRVHPRAAPGHQHLQVAHATLSGVFESLHVVRQAAADKDARGRLRDPEVDLLRSALILAGAGLDAVIRRLARDALPNLLAVGSPQTAAHRAFKEQIRGEVRDKSPSDSWTRAILADDPRQAMIDVYVRERTQGSLQSEKDLKRIRQALGITDTVIPDDRIAELRPFLTARNQVAHDLDIKDPGDETWGPRYSRTVTTVVKQCNLALSLSDSFVVAVSDALGGPPALGRPRKRASQETGPLNR